MNDETMRTSAIFGTLLKESRAARFVDEEDVPFSDITLDDGTIGSSKCGIAAYNADSLEDASREAYNPKTNPDKAVDIVLTLPDGNEVEVFLDPNDGEWHSSVNGGQGSLSPDQMEQLFRTDFCKRVDSRLERLWPESDPYFGKLLEAVRSKKVCLEPCGTVTEDSNVFRKGNIDAEKSRQKNAAGRQERTRSGRKIITPSDFNVRHDENEAYFVWPAKGKEFKWSQWADWNKIRPVARMRLTVGQFTYGISFSPILEDNENRGAKSYNLDLEPKLQYLTPEETSEMLKLSLVQKFLRNAKKRITKYLEIPDEEIFEKVGAPERCTIDDIRKTKHVIRNTLKAIRDGRADTYVYT